MARRNGVLPAILGAAIFVLAVRTAIRGQSTGTGAAAPAAPAAEESPAYYQTEVVERPGTAIALLVDTSGSMGDPAPGDTRPKHVVAREAIEHVLLATDAFARERPDYPISISIIGFASGPWEVLPFQPYDHEAVARALERLPRPGGGTAIGAALQAGRVALYRSGAVRKYVVAVTDGQNTVGSAPDRVARDIHVKSRGSVSISFVAFDTDPAAFSFLREAGGDVLVASDAAALRQALQQIYEGKILAEAADETAPASPAPPPSKGARPHGRAP